LALLLTTISVKYYEFVSLLFGMKNVSCFSFLFGVCGKHGVNSFSTFTVFIMALARELISGPDLATGARLLSFNRTQTRVVTGLLTGHNTLRRHLHIMGLCNDPMCRKCGTEEDTSVHVLCECEALATLRHVCLSSFFLDPEDMQELGVGAVWNFAKGTGLL
jgi:hypothetical protein